MSGGGTFYKVCAALAVALYALELYMRYFS